MIIADTFRALTAPFAKAFSPADIPHSGAGTQWAWRLPRERDPSARIGDGSATSIIGAVVNWYARSYPEAELRVVRRLRNGEDEVLTPHPLTDLLDQPNQFYDGDALLAGLLFSWVLDGNGYLLKARNAATRVAELWWAPHMLIEPQGPQTGVFIEHYRYTVSGKRFEIDPRDIVHLRFGLDPDNPRKGRSPLKQQLREVLTDEEAARFSAAMVQNVAIPGLVITPKGEDATFDEPEGRALKAKFEQEFGADNRGRAIVTSGATEVHQLGFSPEQLTLRDLRSLPEERITAALGIPAAVVGLGTGLAQTKVGATMHELREMATEQALVPTWRTFARQLTNDLMFEFAGRARDLRLEYDTSKVRVLQEDEDKSHARDLAALAGGALTVANFQARHGYQVDESRNVYLMPATLFEVPEGAPPQPPQQRDRRNGHHVPQEKLNAIQRSGLAFVRTVDRQAVALERQFAQRLAEILTDLGRRATDIYEQLPKQAPQDERTVALIMDGLNIDAFRREQAGPAYAGSYEATGRMVIGALEESYGITISIGAQDEVATRLITVGGRRAGLLDIDGPTRQALFRILADAQAESLGPPAVARRIRSEVPAGPFRLAGTRYRANMIARTELRYATNVSVAATGRAAGFDRYVGFDDRIGFGDPECVGRDGDTVTEEEMMQMIEDEHPNGTLSFAPAPRTEAVPV